MELGLESGGFFVCLTSHVGSSLHFSGTQIWGWRESRFEGLMEVAPGPRQRGARVSETLRLKRGGARVHVQM